MHTAELRKHLRPGAARSNAARATNTNCCARRRPRRRALAAYRGGRGDLQATLSAFDNAIEQRVAYTGLLNDLGQAWAALHFAYPEER